MKYTLVLLLTLIALGINLEADAQNAETLEMRSNFWGNKFFKGDTIISVNQVLYEMSPNESIYNLMVSAKKDFVMVQVVGAVGGLLIGIPVGTALVGGEPKWVLAGIGAGLVAITIPISINFKKKANEAINQHNSLISTNAKINYKPTVKLGINSYGLNFQLRF